MNEDVKIEAFDFESGISVGVFNSISQAAKKLFIRNQSVIWDSLCGKKNMTFKGTKKGISSYKDGKKYTFKILS